MTQALPRLESDQSANPNHLLFASDFDGTKFLTSEEGDGIYTVSEAYAEGIRDLLGKRAVSSFVNQGGHQHRTPAEIITDLCPDMGNEEIETHARRLTLAKIAILTEQIGRPLKDGALWPRPTNGFVTMWENLEEGSEKDIAVTTADLSAGHTPFIERTYDVHGLKLPDMIVTDDFLVDELGYEHVPPAKRAKPETLLLESASMWWLSRLVISQRFLNWRDQLANIIYVGDSPEKDGGMADNYGVYFVLLDPTRSEENWQTVSDWLNRDDKAKQGTVA